ncbi:MAG: transcriptional repressor [Actinobacteria bacterium]|nr:transcriptional repressor [Actinomycetota bacterium]
MPRVTRQGAAVRAALASRTEFVSAQELHAQLRGKGVGVGLTTVYRHLQALVDSKQVDVLQTPDGQTVYRLCAREEHHHHLVCRHCGRTVEIEGREVERWTYRIAEAEGFVDVEHTVEVFGTCGECAARRS